MFPKQADELCFEFVCVRKAVRGDWFFGLFGGLFPWAHDGESKDEHRIYRLNAQEQKPGLPSQTTVCGQCLTDCTVVGEQGWTCVCGKTTLLFTM